VIRPYQMSTSDFDALAAGRGGPAALATLRSSQLSKTLLVLRHIVRRYGSDATAAATAVLSDAQDRDPALVTELLTEPWTGVWATRCLRYLEQGSRPSLTRQDESYVNALAATAAAGTGIDTDLPMTAPAGEIHLPGWGTVLLTGRRPTARVMVSIRSRRLTVTANGEVVVVPPAPGRSTDNWSPVRNLTAGSGTRRLRLELADLGPYRDCYRMTPADRLTTAEAADWGRLLDSAWRLLVRHAPERADELSAALRALVPLAATEGRPGLSATARDAFGALALTRPTTPATFAVTLVHEYQHAKLNALLDLVALHHKSDGTRYFAPWRPDPRPIGGFLHGVYAFLGVADMWRVLRAEPDLQPLAEQQFAHVREQLRVAIQALTGSAELTRDGQLFTAGLRTSVKALLTVPVPATATATARETVAREQENWHQAHA